MLIQPLRLGEDAADIWIPQLNSSSKTWPGSPAGKKHQHMLHSSHCNEVRLSAAGPCEQLDCARPHYCDQYNTASERHRNLKLTLLESGFYCAFVSESLQCTSRDCGERGRVYVLGSRLLSMCYYPELHATFCSVGLVYHFWWSSCLVSSILLVRSVCLAERTALGRLFFFLSIWKNRLSWCVYLINSNFGMEHPWPRG